jgi:hypothetical protein
LSPNATWYPNAITFADNTTVGANPTTIFIDRNDTIYVIVEDKNLVKIWNEGNVNPTRTISNNLSSPCDLFVINNGEIYITNSYNYQINKWTLNATYGEPVMLSPGTCSRIFIDLNNYFYCSMFYDNQVIKISLNENSSIWTTVAGNTTAGSESNMLNQPESIFVDQNFNLFVADWSNNRIQKFSSEQLNGSTVAGNGDTITLSGPTDVVLDDDGYIFIVDWNGERIVGSGPYGFRCLVGCSGLIGSTSSQLYYPTSFAFDRYANIFVVDNGNQRIQKFFLINYSDGNFQI